MIFHGEDWVSMHAETWRKFLRFDGPIRALEIGSFEGRSAVWFLENLPVSMLTCIDPWDGSCPTLGAATIDAEKSFDANMEGFAGRVRKMKGKSRHLLPLLWNPPEMFELIYVDGSHEGIDALTDICLCWQLLAFGGILVFDDYRWQGQGVSVPPCKAWDAFAEVAKPWFDLLHCFRQVIVRKK